MSEKKSPLLGSWGWVWPVALFSLLINALYLTGPIFMMQVYDRVLPSANVATLIGLMLIVLLLYGFFGVLDYLRGQLIQANAEKLTSQLAETAYRVSILDAGVAKPDSSKANALDDVSALRGFLVSPVFSALFDLPWAPVFLLFIFGLHPVLGVIALTAALVLSVLAIINERISRRGARRSEALNAEARRHALLARRNAEALRGNGMVKALGDLWRGVDFEARQSGVSARAINSSFAVSTKTLRLVIQSSILAAGAYYTVQGEMTPGAMIAGSIIFGRALAPLDVILNGFSNLARAKDAWARISTWCHEDDPDAEKPVLPAPSRSLSVQDLIVVAPGSTTAIVNQMSFSLQAGDVLGVMGPSGSGKSTLGRALIGAWAATHGTVRLDNAELDHWPRELLGRHIGYLPQDIELFDATVTANIARLDEGAPFDEVLAASQLAGIHEMVSALPDGYNTHLGEGGVVLSAGQRQRIALARALYGNPFFVVLDEPNSNLDAVGDRALANALESLRESRRIAVVIAHRQSVLSSVNKLMLVKDGTIAHIGDRDTVLAMVQEQVSHAMGRAVNA